MIHIPEQVSQTSDITTKESSVRESWVMMQTRCTSVSELVFYLFIYFSQRIVSNLLSLCLTEKLLLMWNKNYQGVCSNKCHVVCFFAENGRIFSRRNIQNLILLRAVNGWVILKQHEGLIYNMHAMGLNLE